MKSVYIIRDWKHAERAPVPGRGPGTFLFNHVFATRILAEEHLAHEMNSSSIKWDDKFWRYMEVEAIRFVDVD